MELLPLVSLSLAGQSKAQKRTPLAEAAWVKAVLAGEKHAPASAGYGVREMLLQRLVTSVLAQTSAHRARVVLWLSEPIAASGAGWGQQSRSAPGFEGFVSYWNRLKTH